MRHAVDADDYNFDANCEVVAASHGCKVIYPASNQLQIDIDSEEAYALFTRRADEMEGFFSVFDVDTAPSKSGLPNRHITITTDREFSEVERILFQFCLGSDPIRETLNTYRLLSGTERPTRLFESLIKVDEAVNLCHHDNAPLTIKE